jgi:hypothetical protein
MTKTAQDAYLEGRQAAMEKLSASVGYETAGDMIGTRLKNQVFFQTPAYLANAMGVLEARKAGNPNAEMTWHGYSRPGVYGVSGLVGGGLLGYGLGKAYDSYVRDPAKSLGYVPEGRGLAIGAGLGLLGGYGYGLRRSYQIPGEM